MSQELVQLRLNNDESQRHLELDVSPSSTLREITEYLKDCIGDRQSDFRYYDNSGKQMTLNTHISTIAQQDRICQLNVEIVGEKKKEATTKQCCALF